MAPETTFDHWKVVFSWGKVRRNPQSSILRVFLVPYKSRSGTLVAQLCFKKLLINAKALNIMHIMLLMMMLMATMGFTLHLAGLDLLMLIYNCSRIWLKVHFAILWLDPIFFCQEWGGEKQSLSTVIKPFVHQLFLLWNLWKYKKAVCWKADYSSGSNMKTMVFWV